MYKAFAAYYDTIAAFDYSEAVFPLIMEILKTAQNLPSGIVIDWGCGTGTMACKLAASGWPVIGVDRSENMLEQARLKALSQHINEDLLQWVQGDICHHVLHSTKNTLGRSDTLNVRPNVQGMLALCLCNTLNHLTTENQVQWFAANLYKHLLPGGLAILDIDTLDTFVHYFNAPETLVMEDETQRITREASFNSESGLANHWARQWQWDNTGETRKTEEFMQLRYYAKDVLNVVFEEAKLSVLAVIPYNPIPHYYDLPFIPKQLWLLKREA
jgi:SAM-dependent methyltransferase